MIYANRIEAGRALATRLLKYAGSPNVKVVALPRGGVPIGYEVAKVLKLPLDVLLVRKLGWPECEDLAMGAIAVGGITVINQEVVRRLGIPDEEVELVAVRERAALESREELYRHGRRAAAIKDQIVIVVDDGIATGCSMEAAVRSLRAQKPARLIVAVPVAPQGACDRFENEVDELVCLVMPEAVSGISSCYADFNKVTDREASFLLDQAGQRTLSAGGRT